MITRLSCDFTTQFWTSPFSAGAHSVTDEPMPKSAFTEIFHTTLHNAGYMCATSIHAIRRQLGKKVDELYTEVQRSQHLTQADPRIFGQS